MSDISVLVASEIVSAGLAFVVAYLFFRGYRYRRSTYLLGPLVGFSFLAFSYIFLGWSLVFGNIATISESFLWLRLITQTYGFAFIAFAYYFSRKSEEQQRSSLGMILLISAISIFLLVGILIAAPPFPELPSTNVADEWFTAVNLVFLGYVIFALVRLLETLRKTVSSWAWAPLAFCLLWLAQYSWLIWGVDGSQTALVFAHGARLASLAFFIFIYGLSRRVRDEGREAQQNPNLL